MQNNHLFIETLKKAMDTVKESTLKEMLSEDLKYQELGKLAEEAESAYMEMELSEEQKRIIDNFMDSRSRVDSEYSSVSYLAGIRDAIRILRCLHQIE